jgi:hypothetical protein
LFVATKIAEAKDVGLPLELTKEGLEKPGVLIGISPPKIKIESQPALI